MAMEQRIIAEAVLANCIHILIADGEIVAEEIKALELLAKKLGYPTPLSIHKVLDYGFRIGTADFDEHQKLLCLSECLKVMFADKIVHEAEARSWVQLAVSFGYDQERARDLFDNLCPTLLNQEPSSKLIGYVRAHFDRGTM